MFGVNSGPSAGGKEGCSEEGQAGEPVTLRYFKWIEDQAS